MTREELQKRAYELAQEQCTWTFIGELLGVHRKTAKRLAKEWEKKLWDSKKLSNMGYDIYVSNTVGGPWVKSSNYFSGAATVTASSTTQPPLIMDFTKPSTKKAVPFIDGNDISLERFQPIYVSGNAVVSCDWHVPLHDPYMVNKLLELSYNKGIKQLIIAGDFFNQDSTSQYLPHQKEAALTREREEAVKIFTALLQIFDEIVLTSGNHDYRLVKFFNHTLDFDYLVRWMLSDIPAKDLNRVKVSYLDYLIYEPCPDLSIYVCHPENFSGQPLSIARALVPKFNMSVLTAHSHHFAQGVAADGKHLVFDGGGLFSLNKTEYIKKTNKHHTWAQGFYIFEDGIAQPYSPLYRNL